MANHTGFSYAFTDLQQLSTDVLAYARKQGASACEVDVSEGFGQSVTVRCDAVDTIEYNRDKGVGVTVYAGHARATPVPRISRRRRCVTPWMRHSPLPASRQKMTAPVWPMRR